MPITRLTAHVLFAGLLATATAAATTRTRAQEPPCATTMAVPGASFHRLDGRARHAYVWIDDIQTRFFVNYRPFDLFVLVGRTIPPFQAESGRLDRAGFERIAKASYNTRQFGPLRVDPDTVADDSATLRFSAGGRPFTLSVLSVSSGRRDGWTARLRLCWPDGAYRE
ncbi:MAG: hypothetical protein AB7O67_21255 [Vicinamibacterales bacterium]